MAITDVFDEEEEYEEEIEERQKGLMYKTFTRSHKMT